MTKRPLLLLLGLQETQSTINKNIQQRFSTDLIAANFDVSEVKAVDFLFIKCKEYKERGE
ncbi:MAG: hypothetical protein COA40_01565 [Aequorivita sp.]|nr:MAG: hypothetical protein COA40_01565 [Aequorivita sp.]